MTEKTDIGHHSPGLNPVFRITGGERPPGKMPFFVSFRIRA